MLTLLQARHGEFCSKECIIEVFEDKEKPAKEDMKDMNVKEDEEDEDMKSAGGKDNDMEEEEMKDEKEDADEDVIEEYEIMEENEEMKADMPKKKKHQHHHHEHKKHVKKNEKKKNKIKFATSNMVETETLEEQAEVVDTKAVVAESEVEVDTKKPKLGFIGEIFKAIVKHNTWRSA